MSNHLKCSRAVLKIKFTNGVYFTIGTTKTWFNVPLYVNIDFLKHHFPTWNEFMLGI